MAKLHASMPKHRPSTMRFLKKTFGVRPRSAGAIKSTVKKSGTVARTTRGRKNP